MTDNQRCENCGDAKEQHEDGVGCWVCGSCPEFTPPAAAVERCDVVPPTDGTNPSDEFIRGSISGAKNAVATERLRRKLMPSDDGALEYQLERFEEAFRWLVDGRADGAINMQMAIAKMRTAIEAPRHTNSSEELTDD